MPGMPGMTATGAGAGAAPVQPAVSGARQWLPPGWPSPAQLGGADMMPTMVAWPMPATGMTPMAPMPPMPAACRPRVRQRRRPPPRCAGVASGVWPVADGKQAAAGHPEQVGHGRGPVAGLDADQVAPVAGQAERAASRVLPGATEDRAYAIGKSGTRGRLAAALAASVAL